MNLASLEAVVRAVTLRVVAMFRSERRASLARLESAIDAGDTNAAFDALYALLRPAMVRAFVRSMRGQPPERLRKLAEMFAQNAAI
jgi:hypothetical protein